jgi:hypothetical protein
MVFNMKRNKMIEKPNQEQILDIKQRVAFHEAGHAAGIHLNNKARKLPPIFFNIIFKDINDEVDTDILAYQATQDKCIARVEGGILIEMFSPPIQIPVRETDEFNDVLGEQLAKDYMVAFEADIINLLVGSLAEAKHVANIDAELFNNQLVGLKALKNYGGKSDLTLVNEYLLNFSVDKQQRDEKLDKLFTLAFNFINNDETWAAISQLADYFLGSHKNTFHCEEITSILDESIKNFQK